MKLTMKVFAIAVACLAVSSGIARANARLVSVVPLDGGCVAGPTGNSVQFWDVEPGKTYRLTITNVTECGNGGTAPTINVRVNNSAGGNVDLVATLIAPGTYVFDYTVPLTAACTGPIFSCTTPGRGGSGTFVQRNDGETFQSHLRAATFGPGCTNPTEVPGPGCSTVPTRSRTWGSVKAIYR